MNSNPLLSVVILCYRAGAFAKVFVERMEKALKDSSVENYELVLVGNYTPNTNDTTPKVITELAVHAQHIRTVIEEKFPREKKGMGYDMRSGLTAATGDVIAVIDGDGQMPPEDVVRIYNSLLANHLDLCKTRREIRHDGWWRKFISSVFNILMMILFPGIHAPDINGKPKIFRRSAYEKMHLTSNDWFIDAEIMLEARMHKLKIGAVPTTFFANEERPSFISYKAIFEFLINIIYYRFKTLF